MAYTLTSHYDEVIERLIRAGHFGNRSEVVRAGLRKLEQEYLGADYLRPPPLPPGALARTYRRQTKAEREEERRAVRASRKPRPEE
jgi:Arc/MetJ-type ribon-helix-helix transcriptional regulator